MKRLVKLWKNRAGATLLLFLLALGALVVMTTAISFRVRAKSIGTSAGKTVGRAVGLAIGSADGLINGLREGGEAGAAAGLSAADTTVSLQDSMRELGKLEVLAAGVTLRNINRIGGTYAGLSLMNGDAVFSVDMTQADISFSQDGKEAYIVIPKPELELYPDLNSSEMLFEIQKPSFQVSAEDGLISYLNSMAQTVGNAKETIANYDSLMEQAQESAQTQVKRLAETLCGGRYTVVTRFQ